MNCNRKTITLGEACSRLSSGKGISASNIHESGLYPVYGGNGLRGYTDTPNFEGQCAIIGRQGAFCGNVRFFQGTAYMTEHAVVAVATSSNNTRYLAYLLSTMNLGRLSGQSAQPGLSVKTLSKQVIELPPKEEQDKVVAVLSALDDKIELNNRINDSLEQQVVALYTRLLEADWPVETIKDVAKKVAMGPFGSNIKVSTFVPEGVPIISGNHLRGFFLDEPEFNYITEEHAEKLKNSIVYPRDLIFTHAGNIGQVAMIPDGCKHDYYVLSQRQFYLRCDENKVVPEFMLMFFHSAIGQHELLSYANRTGVPSIAQPASNLKKIPFKCPPIEEQTKWNELVHPLIIQYLNNRHENECLAKLRNALLPKLMSGELDISEVQI